MAGRELTVAGLFAGIGGIELGLHAAGHSTALLCEIDPGAKRVLEARFPEIELLSDIRELDALPDVDLVTAGFPCQDLSQAGRTAGIAGRNSGLVEEVFRLIEGMEREPRWLLLENVPFMLQLDRGEAMRYLTSRLTELGFTWAYRIVDARAFGLPQRRKRVLLLASRTDDPREVLFHGDAGEPDTPAPGKLACGFYWTEGIRGLGWAVDAVPTLKGGSTIGIPSPPAIWMPDGEIALPEIRDAERLQGFPPNWTNPALDVVKKQGHRWKLVGNAVSVPLAKWVGERLLDPRSYDGSVDEVLRADAPWPSAAWGDGGGVRRADVSAWPLRRRYRHLAEFLRFPTKPLSVRATAGFLDRARLGYLRFADGFLEDVEEHLERLTDEARAA
jgi:DNA (cytosine-5)-methyltransferase 1